MTFIPEKVDSFLEVFNVSKHLIRNFDGCKGLKLLNDKNSPSIFFTYSIWENSEALENYRNSELFKSTWAKTKILFAGKPEAYSTNAIFEE